MSELSLEMSLDTLRFVRSSRSHLIGPGAEDAVACARTLLGAQAQVLECALHALSLRVASAPSRAELCNTLYADASPLVRTWGQRDTLHIYATQDWPMIIASRPLWVRSGRIGGMPSNDLLDTIANVFATSEKPLTRADLFPHIPKDYADSLINHSGVVKGDTTRFAATRLIWCLATRGVIAFADRRGSENTYVHRSRWDDVLSWPDDVTPEAASAQATCRYLSVFGPSSVADIAHHLGARISDVKRWTPTIQHQLIEVRVPELDASPLLALREDADMLHAAKIPEDDAEWPARLLPAYDTMLMAHKNKRAILPDAAEEPLVWRKAAVVMPVVIDRGQISAHWSHTVKRDRLDVAITPMSAWREEARPALEADARRFATHLGLTTVNLSITPPVTTP